MTKKPKNPLSKKPFPSLGVKNALGKVGEIVKIAVQHPSAAALAVMATASTARMIILSAQSKENLKWVPGFIGGSYGSKDPRSDAVLSELSGIYIGAQGLGLAAAVAPIATSALGMATQVLKKP